MCAWHRELIRANRCRDVHGTVVHSTENIVLGPMTCVKAVKCLYVHGTVVHGTENMVLGLFEWVKAEKCLHVHGTAVSGTEDMVLGCLCVCESRQVSVCPRDSRA